MKQRKSVIALLIVAIVGIVGLTFAYFSNSSTVENEFNTLEYGTRYTEEFVSPDNWLPGDTTSKTITATNTGETDEAVRIHVSEAWATNNNSTNSTLNGWIHTDGTKSTHTTNEELANDERVAILNLANTSDWTKVGDYYYYNYKLAPNESTTSFLESVTFNSKTKLDDTCETTIGEGTRTISCSSSGDDYDNATYTLTLTIETVQYNKYAQAWNTGNTVTIANTSKPTTEPEDYVVTTTEMNIGQALPNGVTLKTAAQAKADWVDISGSEKPFYLKQILNGSDEISESYVCFERNDTQYCLKGGDSGASFLSNAKIIYDAFEGEGCTSDFNNITTPYDSNYNPSPSSNFYCASDLNDYLNAYAYSDGYVLAYDGCPYCDVSSDGSSRCVE